MDLRAKWLVNFCLVWFCQNLCSSILIDGVGGILPANVYQSAMALRTITSTNEEYQISYEPIGSSVGVQLLLSGANEYAGSDAPLSDNTYLEYPDIQTYPTVASAIALIHNLHAFKSATQSNQLVFSRESIAKIYLGEITQWNDPELVALNPGANLPGAPITIYVWTEEVSAVTQILTESLSSFYASFKNQIGATPSPNWCANTSTTKTWTLFRGAGRYSCELCCSSRIKKACRRICKVQSSFVIEIVAGDEFSIGYAQFDPFALQKVQIANLRNKFGTIVTPNATSVGYAAIESAVTLGHSLTASIVDSASPFAWPISAFVYIVVRTQTQVSNCKARSALVHFWHWFLQSPNVGILASQFGLSPMPQFIANLVCTRLVHEVKCVNNITGDFQLAAPELANTNALELRVSDQLVEHLLPLNQVYNQYQQDATWAFVPSTSKDIFSRFTGSNESSFILFFPELVQEQAINDFAVVSGAYAAPFFLQHVIPVYSIPDLTLHSINMTGELLAAIFSCTVTTWDDPLLLHYNSELRNITLNKRNITLIYPENISDSFQILLRFLSQYIPNLVNINSPSEMPWSQCAGSVAVDSEWMMGVNALKYGAFTFVGQGTAKTFQLQTVALVDASGFILPFAPSTKNTDDCVAVSTIQTITASAVILQHPVSKNWQGNCWPITSAIHALIRTKVESPSCTTATLAAQYMDWILHGGKGVTGLLQSNYIFMIDASARKSSWYVLQHSLECDGELLLFTPPPCSVNDYEYTISQCQGWFQSRNVQYNWKNDTQCKGGIYLPSNCQLDCDHIVWRSSYGAAIIASGSLGLLGWSFIHLIRLLDYKLFVKALNVPRNLLNEIALILALFAFIGVFALGTNTATLPVCIARLWLFNIPSDFLFSILYSRMRVGQLIFKSRSVKRFKVTFRMLLKYTLEMMGPEVMILVLWSLASTPEPVLMDYYSLVDPSLPFREIDYYECSSAHNWAFKVTLAVYKGCWLVRGSYISLQTLVGSNLAFQVWNLKSQNETRSIALGIFSFVLLSATVIFVDFRISSVSLKTCLISTLTCVMVMATTWPLLWAHLLKSTLFSKRLYRKIPPQLDLIPSSSKPNDAHTSQAVASTAAIISEQQQELGKMSKFVRDHGTFCISRVFTILDISKRSSRVKTIVVSPLHTQNLTQVSS